MPKPRHIIVSDNVTILAIKVVMFKNGGEVLMVVIFFVVEA